MYLISRQLALNTSRCFNEIKWALFGDEFPSKKKAKRVCRDSPLLANALTLGVSHHRGGRKSIVVDAIRRERQPFFVYTQFSIELPVSLADVQESINAA